MTHRTHRPSALDLPPPPRGWRRSRTHRRRRLVRSIATALLEAAALALFIAACFGWLVLIAA